MPPIVLATAYGGPEVLAVIDDRTPEPGPGEARIEVKAAGVNPVDYKIYAGIFNRDPAALPIRIGSEAAGIVTHVGEAASGPAGPIRPGDEVIAFRTAGAYAAELVVPAQALVPKPATLGWPEASGLMLTGVTAWHCLIATGVSAGDTVLIHAGAGGVGVMAIQLAVDRGASVIATASPGHHDLIRGLGATPVAHGPGLADRVRATAPGGIVAAFGRAGQAGIKALGGGPGADPGTEIRAAARPELAQLAGAGRLRVIMAGTFPLASAADAHRSIRSGHTAGKIALIP